MSICAHALAGEGAEGERKREKPTSLSKEPKTGLDSMTLRSRSQPKSRVGRLTDDPPRCPRQYLPLN